MESGWRSAKPRKKTQAEKRSEQRMRNSYFTQQYEAYGENFSNFKDAQLIKKESFRIFKSLADCAVDLNKHGKCFTDPIFVGVLKDVAFEKSTYHYYTQMGLEQIINVGIQNNCPVDPIIYENCGMHRRSAEAYTLLYQAFLNIQLTGDYVTILSSVMPILNKYKYSL